MSIENPEIQEQQKTPENREKQQKLDEAKYLDYDSNAIEKIDIGNKLNSYNLSLDKIDKSIENIKSEQNVDKKAYENAMLYVQIDRYQKDINEIKYPSKPIRLLGDLDKKCTDLQNKIMGEVEDKEKFNAMLSELFNKISNKDFLKYTSKDQRLEKITKPPKEAKDVKSGDDIRFTFTFENKLNENLYLKTTAGQVLPSEVRNVEFDGVSYSRNSIGGEFFTTNNERLTIHEGTQIKIGKIGSPEEITKISKENELKVAEYLKQNPEANSKIVSESINRGIDPKFAVMTFSDLVKGQTDENEINAILEDAFTEFDRTRGHNNVPDMASIDKSSGSGLDFLITLLSKFLGDNWKTKAKEYGISDENIKIAETNGSVNMGLDSNSIKNADSLPDGSYLKGQKLLENSEFSNKLDEVCVNIGANRNDLIKIMQAESINLDPRAVNPHSNATGLIQFMPRTAEGLGTSVGKIRGMTGVEQLEYVEKYFKQNSKGNNLNTIEKLYQAVFYPASLLKGPDFVFGSQDGKADLVKTQNGVIAKFSTRPDGFIDGYAFSRYVQNHVSKLPNLA